MNLSEFTRLFTSTMKTLEGLLIVKGGEYAGSDDRLANFKRGANLTGTTPLQVAFIYASKHYDAVATYVRDTATGTQRERSESIDGRLDDLMNYCLLMKALVVEARNSELKAASAQTPTPHQSDIGIPAPGSWIRDQGAIR